MALRFVRQVWQDWQSAVRDIASALSSMLRDEDQPARWDPEITPAQSIVVAGLGAPATWDSAEAALSFSPTATNVAQGHQRMPHTWHEGTSVMPYVHVYSAASASAASNIAVVRLRYKFFLSAAPAAWTTLSQNYTLQAGVRLAQRIEFGGISGTGLKIGSMFAWEFARLGAATADTYSSALLMTHFGINVQHARGRGSPRQMQTGYD